MLAALVALCTGAALRAQSVHWENGDSQFGSMVQLVFDGCEPNGEPQLPRIEGVTLTRVGESTSVNMINGDVTKSVILSYLVQSRHGGALQIPAFDVKTNKGDIHVAAFNGAAPAISADSVASSKLIPDHTTVWAGEVFGLDYQITAPVRNNPHFNPTFDWTAAPLVAEDWSKFEISEGVANGQRELTVTSHTRAYARTPSTLKLEPVTHLLNIQTGSVNFGFIPQPRMEPVSVVSDQPTIEVRPLPTPPAGFSGAVGQFKFTSTVVPQQANVGDPITWTLELSGTGNWPDIQGLPAREVSKDFRVVQPKAKRTPAEGKLFDATISEDVVLVPTKAGQYTLPPVKFIYFDPQSGTYQTLRTEATTVTVNAAPAPASNPAAAPAPGTPSSAAPSASAANPKPLVEPAPPAGIPRDPLPGSEIAARPLSLGAFVAWLCVPALAVIAFWLLLAWRRALATDPLRPEREARTRLSALLGGLRLEGISGRRTDPAVLLEWQKQSAILWHVHHAAPSAGAIADVAWQALWREADRAIYGADGTLASDWVARAEAALAAKSVPPFRARRLFLPQNLLPFAAIVAALVAFSSHGLRASSPDADYRAGNFGAAEKAWRETVTQRPTDWIARHNLALALAQQDRAGEAVAEAAAAFVQNPANASVRWHFALLADKAGFAPGPLLPFLKEGPIGAIVGLAGPAGWQRIAIFAAFVVAVALGWLLLNAYGRRQSLQVWLAATMGAIALLVAALGVFSFVAYGETSDIRTVVAWHAGTLRSIPTEADTTQKTTTLSPGSVAIVDKTFLGWERLQFSNGQTGWIRKDDVIPLWR